MLAPFLAAWPGPTTTVLTTDTRSVHPRRSVLGNAEGRQLLGRASAQGARRIAAMPIALSGCLLALRRGTTAYARLPSPLGACLVLAATIRGRPFMCSLHGTPRWSRPESSWQALLGLRMIYRAAARKFLSRAQVLFATDTGLAEVYGLRPESLTPFSNTLLREIPPLPERADSSDRRIHLGFVGRLTPEKNPRFALDVVRHLNKSGVAAQLSVIGDGRLGDELREAARRSEGSVEMCGWIADREDLVTRLRSWDYLLLPSLSEGSPKVMVEGMAMGAVVVTWGINARVVGLADGGRAAMLLPGLDAAEWAAAIRETSSEPEAYHSLALRAHQRVQGETVGSLIDFLRQRIVSASMTRSAEGGE